jgi:hypothetical protein
MLYLVRWGSHHVWPLPIEIIEIERVESNFSHRTKHTEEEQNDSCVGTEILLRVNHARTDDTASTSTCLHQVAVCC